MTSLSRGRRSQSHLTPTDLCLSSKLDTFDEKEMYVILISQSWCFCCDIAANKWNKIVKFGLCDGFVFI